MRGFPNLGCRRATELGELAQLVKNVAREHNAPVAVAGVTSSGGSNYAEVLAELGVNGWRAPSSD